MSFITAIGTAVPEYKLEQSAIAQFMEQMAVDDEQKRKLKTVFRASGIKTRHSVLSDYGKTRGFSFFPNTSSLDPFPGTEQRMQAYRQHAIGLSISAVKNIQTERPFHYDSITHLITVSCTGMYAPGLDIDLVKLLPLPSSVNRTCINFMGCFAAINALKTADAFCKADASAKVLIVCTELCSLHFQKDFTDDNILANALFADGSAAMLLENDEVGAQLSLEGFYSDIAHQGAGAMAWSIGNLGFEMKLSSYVPEILRNEIQGLVNGLVSRTGLNQNQINHFAVHPGGKKILDAIAEALTISPDRLSSGYQVLRDYGNMSSPTIVFVLKSMVDAKQIRSGDSVMAMAFGPGLTMESVLIRSR